MGIARRYFSIGLTLLSLCCGVLTGCATQSGLYHWGNYEQIIYNMYINPGSADPRTQIQALSVDIQEAENHGKKVAPGVYAHLGMMYAMLGDGGDAMAAFEMEKKLYPESSHLVDGMIERAKRKSGE